MKRKVLHCNKGDILLIPFPFTDLSSSKLRPGVVLAQDKNDMTLIFITSQKPKGEKFLELNPTKENGIKVKSYIRYTKVATLDLAMSLGQIGKLDRETHSKIVSSFNDFIAI